MNLLNYAEAYETRLAQALGGKSGRLCITDGHCWHSKSFPGYIMEHVIIRVARTIEHSKGWHDEPSWWLVIKDVLA